MKNRKVQLIAVIVIVFLIFLFIKLSEVYLNRTAILLNAKTTEWVSGAKMGMSLQYEFCYEGKKIVGNNSFGKIRGNIDFEGRYFPVMYDPIFRSSKLLIEPSDFKKFNLPFPDSLNWVLPYLNLSK